MTMYDVIDRQGRVLNSQPLSYAGAEFFAMDYVMNTDNRFSIVETTRTVEKLPDNPNRIPWLFLTAVVAAVILGVVVVGCL